MTLEHVLWGTEDEVRYGKPKGLGVVFSILQDSGMWSMPPPFSLITYITHIRIFYLLSLMVTDIGPMEIITMVSIKLCPISLQIHSQLNQGFCAYSASIIYHSDIEFHKCRKQRRGNKWLEREEGSPETTTKMRPGKEKKKKKKQRRQQNASLCLLAVELLFEMKIQSVWGITVDWQAHGSQAVICTPVIWSMVIIAVCVCMRRSVCLLLWSDEWQFKQTHNVVNQKKPFLFDHVFFFTSTASIRGWNTSKSVLLFFFPNYTFYSLLSLGHLFSFSSPFIHTFTASFLPFPFIPASGPEKPPSRSIGLERQ